MPQKLINRSTVNNNMCTITPKQRSPILFMLLLLITLFNLYQIISGDVIKNNPTISSASTWVNSKWISLRSSASKSNYTSNLLRVDPRLILQTMNKFSGLVLPSYLEDDLKILEHFCRCKSSYL